MTERVGSETKKKLWTFFPGVVTGIAISFVAAVIYDIFYPFLPNRLSVWHDLEVKVKRHESEQVEHFVYRDCSANEGSGSENDCIIYPFDEHVVEKIEVSLWNKGWLETGEIQLFLASSGSVPYLEREISLLVDENGELAYPNTIPQIDDFLRENPPRIRVLPLLPKQSVAFSLSSKYGVGLLRIQESGRTVDFEIVDEEDKSE